MGKPLTQAKREVDTTLDRAETMLRLAPAALQDDQLPPKEGFRRFIRHEPLGIVLDIPAWNYPLLIAVNVVIPGPPRRQRRADQARPPDTALRRRLCRRLPENDSSPDLVASIHVDHATVSRLIDRAPSISFRLPFRGWRPRSLQTGLRTVARHGLELGGKDPALVCEDANFDFAVANLVDGAFYNAGQSCCAIERIYVMRPLFSKFIDAYVAEVEKYKVGNPEDPRPTLARSPSARPSTSSNFRSNRPGPRRPSAYRRQARTRPAPSSNPPYSGMSTTP
jgi:hypothetical protein